MKQFHYIITDKAGIHARPAGVLVKKAKNFESSIEVRKDVRKADAKKLLELMGLGIRFNDEIIVEVSGTDEEAACDEIRRTLKEVL
ncbi:MULTISPECIES: HPr family phosphocarrier protein [Sellimonas]|uniref:HPr family phosphocarrier protein n=1 Tax=Sellimonas caecigallum TaxID=2592333 RepID=A0ABS7L4A6_9FIRM|nr:MULTISPECIES: HPr family phosphocarrier protein [Sellimonas]MBY0757873.1 HPr family phosphocarrier protein [Sellimonas caecigallum]OUP01115.1 PTS galactitol transporter subunit IIC [Drancourtella sp. An210]OUP63469.1 PTS galactitol transporter subunit IIC [Drancourtella sp. An177]